jgi:hypothetical protein
MLKPLSCRKPFVLSSCAALCLLRQKRLGDLFDLRHDGVDMPGRQRLDAVALSVMIGGSTSWCLLVISDLLFEGASQASTPAFESNRQHGYWDMR